MPDENTVPYDLRDYKAPVWNGSKGPHNWRSYVGQDLRKMWESLDEDAQLGIERGKRRPPFGI